jgi:hypothetical protein
MQNLESKTGIEKPESVDPYRLLSDRWLEPLDDVTGPDRGRVRTAAEWCNLLAPADKWHHAGELVFLVRGPGGFGYLLEVELDDDTPAKSAEGVETVRRAVAAVAPGGVFSYVAPGTDYIYDGRAAYRVFFAGIKPAPEIEAAASAIFDLVYPVADSPEAAPAAIPDDLAAALDGITDTYTALVVEESSPRPPVSRDPLLYVVEAASPNDESAILEQAAAQRCEELGLDLDDDGAPDRAAVEEVKAGLRLILVLPGDVSPVWGGRQ